MATNPNLGLAFWARSCKHDQANLIFQPLQIPFPFPFIFPLPLPLPLPMPFPIPCPSPSPSPFAAPLSLSHLRRRLDPSGPQSGRSQAERPPKPSLAQRGRQIRRSLLWRLTCSVQRPLWCLTQLAISWMKHQPEAAIVLAVEICHI